MATPPTIVESLDWVAACRPDGGHLTFGEAVEALQAHGVGFDPHELEILTLVDEGGGRFVIVEDDEPGINGWVLRT